MKRKSLGSLDKKAWDRFRFSAKELGDLRQKLESHKASIDLFLTTLGTGSLGRIEKRLDELIQEIRSGKRDSHTLIPEGQKEVEAEQWTPLKEELQSNGFSKKDIDAHKNGIWAYLLELVEKYQLAEPAPDDSQASVTLPPLNHRKKDSAVSDKVCTEVQEYDKDERLRRRTITRQNSSSSMNSNYSSLSNFASSMNSHPTTQSYPNGTIDPIESPFLSSYSAGPGPQITLGLHTPSPPLAPRGSYQLITLETDQGPIQVPVDVVPASKLADEKRVKSNLLLR